MIRAVLIDDEKLSTILLKKKLQQFPIIQVINTYTAPEKFLDDLVKDNIDVVFLDIEMGETSGLDIAETILSVQSSIHIVFVTAHSDYAVRAFEVNSIDYLLKPISSKRLQKTIDRLIELVKNREYFEQKTDKKPLIIKCFHELQLFQNHHLIQFKTTKVKELFAFLLTHIDTYIHKDIIIEKLWPEQDYKKSKIHLHTCLSHLRKMLESLGYSNCISFSNQSYSLHLEPIQCDVIEFNAVINDVNIIDETNKNKAINIIDGYTGFYLELNYYEWAIDISQQYHEKVMYLFDKVITFFENSDLNKAFYYLQRQLKLNPYSEKAVKKSMQILVQQDHRSKAIIMYQEFEELLMEDLGIKPNGSLTQLYHSLITS